MSAAARVADRSIPGGVPGEAGLWVFILADMSLFAVLFAITVFIRADQPALFSAGSGSLDPGLGAVNTMLLISSSLLVVLAVNAARRSSAATSGRLLTGALICASGFIGVKSVEWSDAFSHGDSISTNDFFGLYFMLTGLHLVHVMIGAGVLLALRRQVLKTESPTNFRIVEGGACYWHMVDLLWLVLFPLLYLLG